MKMAKASDVDLKMAMDMVSALESFERYHCFPAALRPDPDDLAPFDDHNGEHCCEAMEHLLKLARSASLMRVVFGMSVLLDPRNKMVDPDADTLEHHPDTEQAKTDSARLRWLTEDHDDPTTRARCRELLGGMHVMSYSAATADIDAAMRECAAVGAA